MKLTVLEPGLHTLLVDFGRPRSRSLGVPVGGAADRFSLAIGNALVGNPPDAPALEISLAGPTLRADGDMACVVYGAPFELTSDRQHLTAGTTLTLHAGEVVHIGGTPKGMRGYFGVRGGFLSPKILGSASSLVPLRAGTQLECLPGTIDSHFIHHDFAWNREPRTLRVLVGPQADWFSEKEFYAQEFTVTPKSNRMGLRLRTKPLTWPARELLSEPVSPGTVQVTRDGQCIILGVDGQTIGGYPKIAQVISADLDKLGQLRPEDSIRFVRVNLVQAEEIYHEKQVELREWVTRLLAAVLSP